LDLGNGFSVECVAIDGDDRTCEIPKIAKTILTEPRGNHLNAERSYGIAERNGSGNAGAVGAKRQF